LKTLFAFIITVFKCLHRLRNHSSFDINLNTEDGEKIPIQVLIIPTIAVPQKSFPTAEIRNLPYLNGLKLAHPMTTDDHFHISLLIGADHYWDVVEDEIVRGPGPTAAKSRIGYLLSGPTTGPAVATTSLNATILKVIVSNEHESKALERFWNLESIGILPDEITTHEDKFVKEYQDSSIRLVNGRYCAKLPWKPNHDPLPTNEAVARGRTRSTVRRLAKDPKILKTYSELINEQLKRGFIERVTNLTVPTFMSAFRRFASRKSLPKIMVSDNASTYQSAAEELTLLFNSAELETNLSKRGIQWKFIPKRWFLGKINWSDKELLEKGSRKGECHFRRTPNNFLRNGSNP
jgi:hypothetical protein